MNIIKFLLSLNVLFIIFTSGSIAQNCYDNNLYLVKEYTSKKSFFEKVNCRSQVEISVDRKSISYGYTNKRSVKMKYPLPIEIDVVLISPNEEYFVSFGDSETHTVNFYLYSANGELINKVKINIYPKVKFSSNGEYFIIHNDFGKNFYLFDSNGNIILQHQNYQELIKSKKAPLVHLNISSDSKLLLLYSDKLYLFSVDDMQLIWKSSWPYTNDSMFLLDKNMVAISTYSTVDKRYFDLNLISLEKGEQVCQMQNIQILYLKEKNKVFTATYDSEKYLEYEIK